MLKKIRDKLFYIGIIIFSLTLITEQLFLGETNITSFLKGFASSILLIGVVILFKNRKNHWKVKKSLIKEITYNYHFIFKNK